MGLAEGTIRKNGLPAKKPGYAKGRKIAGVGGKPRTTCAYEGCDLPPSRGSRGPLGTYCSRDHANRAYREKFTYRRYGITIEDYERILAEQGGRCAICGTDDPKSPGRKTKEGTFTSKGSFHVDHDHDTNLVRGLLCSLCNRMLGHARDSSRNLRLGAEYLERFGR